MKNSHASTKFDKFLELKTHEITADNQLNGCGGFSAAVMMRCEMFGKAALHLKMVVDQHYITTEIL